MILAKNWWSLVIRGLAAICLGVLTFVLPGITLTALVFLFGAYALIDGFVGIAGVVRAINAHEPWGSLLLAGITGIVAAIFTVIWPGITALALVYLIAAWAVLTGGFEIAAAVRLRKYISGEWLLVLSGIASLLLGILMAVVPLAGALAIALWFGVYTLVFGVLLVALGFKLRGWDKSLPGGPSIAVAAH